jgi:2'-5' RNA ligase
MMRLFIAVNLSAEVRRAAGALAGRLRDEVARAARARATWVDPANLHLTLRFLGEVDEATGSRLVEGLSPALPLRAFDVTLGGLGAFPPAGRPRVVWVGVTGGAADLVQVYDLLEARLAPLGLPREDRPYRPHLTLGRFREPAAPLVRTILDRASDFSAGPCRIDEVVLYQSHLAPKGPTYTPLARAPLRAGFP